MRKLVRIAVLVMTLCLMMSAVAAAEKITANGIGYENVPFSNGYNGFCIDRAKSGAYPGDGFSATDTSAATSNTNNKDISASLKVLFTQCFEEMFVSDDHGGYELKNANTVLGAVYHYSEDQYVWGDQKKLTDKVKAYQGPAIPDHGYQLTLAGDEVVTFDFTVLVPVNDNQQSFFAYKIQVSKGHACGDGELIPGKMARCDEDGWENYYCCSCGKYYADQACTQEIDDLAAWKIGAGKTTADHVYGSYVNTDAVKHWKECACGDKTAEGNHEYDNNKDADCNICGYTRIIAHEHTYATTLSYDENYHWYAATCGHDVKSGEEAHHGGTATCTDPAKCVDCGQAYGKTADHVYGNFVNTDAAKHWKECACGDKTAEGNHEYDNNKDADCNICGYARAVAAETFTVAFFANGGTGTMPTKNMNAGAVLSVPVSNFVRTGYTFASWNTEANGSGKTYAAGMTVVVNQNVTLYAQWKPETVEKQMKIDRHPGNQYVVDGQKAVFSVQASGEGLKYQWYIDRNNGKGWRLIEGAQSAAYTTSATDMECDGFRYYCRVTDENGNTLHSDVAVLYVAKAPVLPETGDHSTPVLWLMLGIVSLMGMMILRRKAFVK